MTGPTISGLWADALYRVLGGGNEANAITQVVARTLIWGVVGIFVAIAPGIVMKNSKRLIIGVMGGALGGLLGGLAFDFIRYFEQSGVISRAIGIVAIGGLTGAGTGLIEQVAKTGWLKVVAGLIAGKQFILYKNSTLIGSSPQSDVYLFKDVAVGPKHAVIHQAVDGFELEDLGAPSGTLINGQRVTRSRLRNNDHIQIGATLFVYQEREKRPS